MKKLSVFTIVIALCLGAAAMIQSARVTGGWKSSSIDAPRLISAPYRDGLYVGKLAAQCGGESLISTGRWATEADRTSFTEGFQQGYRDGLVLRASKGARINREQLLRPF